MLLLVFLSSGHLFAQKPGILRQARDYRASGNFAEAVKAYEEALQRDPENMEVLFELAQVNAWSRNDEQALALYDRILAGAPKHADALLGKAILLSWRKEYASAENLFRTVIETVPDYRDAYMALARMLAWQGDYEKAEATLRDSLRQEPDHAETLKTLAQILVWAGRPREAVPLYRRLLETRPDDADLLLVLARAARDAGDIRESIMHFERVKVLAPKRVEVQAELAQLYAQALRLDDAVTELEKLLAVRSSNVEDYVALGRVYGFKNRLDDSRRMYEEALRKDPGNLDALNGLARVQGYVREWKASEQTFQKVLRLDPLNVEARQGLDRIRRFSSPDVTARYDVVRVANRDPQNPPDTEIFQTGPRLEFTYNANPDSAFWVRSSRFTVEQHQPAAGITDLRAVRAEFGAGVRLRLRKAWGFQGQADFIYHSDEGGARLSRSDGVGTAAGFVIAEREIGRQVWSAIFSRDVFLREVPGQGHWDTVASHGYALSDDVSWSEEVSTLFQAGQDFFPYISESRAGALTRVRTRPRFWRAILAEGQLRYRDNPAAWNQTGFLSWKGELHRPAISLELRASVDRDTYADVLGNEGRALLSWKITKSMTFHQDFSYRRNYGFEGSFLVASTYLGCRF